MSTQAESGIAGVVVNAVVRALGELRPPVSEVVEFEDDVRVPAEIADALFDDAAVALDEPAIGLVVARKIPPGALGLLDYALFTGDTWGDAIRRVARFYAAATERVTMAIEEEGDEGRVVLMRHYRGNRHWVEFSFGVITERARQAIGRTFRVRSVDFAHPEPAERAMHERYFGATVRFDQPANRLVFDRALLEARLRTGAHALAHTLEQRLAEIVPVTVDPMMLRVRAAIATSLDDGEAALEQVATKVGTSARSLQRVLHDHGVSFKELVDEMRRDRALTLLRDSELSINEVAAKVGFTDPTAFFRAFRRWTGTTPGAVRSSAKT